MRIAMISSVVLLLVAGPAAAQLPTLDLTAPPKPPEAKAEPRPAPTEVAPLSLTAEPARPADAAQAQAAAPARGGAIFGERDVALGDKVKAVQRKGFLKRGRFELAPILALTVNDAFYQKIGGGLRLAYSPQDAFAVAVRGSYFTPYRTDNVLEGKRAYSSQLLTSQLYGQAMVDGVWSPIYGKASFLADTIVHFDLFLAAGFGAVWSATSLKPRSEGPHPAAEVGGGVRFYPKEWLAFELGLMATFYPDQPVTSVPATIQSVVVGNVGVSFFFPFTFDYVYPQ
jgi:outer membrane beta-barrel protein